MSEYQAAEIYLRILGTGAEQLLKVSGLAGKGALKGIVAVTVYGLHSTDGKKIFNDPSGTDFFRLELTEEEKKQLIRSCKDLHIPINFSQPKGIIDTDIYDNKEAYLLSFRHIDANRLEKILTTMGISVLEKANSIDVKDTTTLIKDALVKSNTFKDAKEYFEKNEMVYNLKRAFDRNVLNKNNSLTPHIVCDKDNPNNYVVVTKEIVRNHQNKEVMQSTYTVYKDGVENGIFKDAKGVEKWIEDKEKIISQSGMQKDNHLLFSDINQHKEYLELYKAEEPLSNGIKNKENNNVAENTKDTINLKEDRKLSNEELKLKSLKERIDSIEKENGIKTIKANMNFTKVDEKNKILQEIENNNVEILDIKAEIVELNNLIGKGELSYSTLENNAKKIDVINKDKSIDNEEKIELKKSLLDYPEFKEETKGLSKEETLEYAFKHYEKVESKGLVIDNDKIKELTNLANEGYPVPYNYAKYMDPEMLSEINTLASKNYEVIENDIKFIEKEFNNEYHVPSETPEMEDIKISEVKNHQQGKDLATTNQSLKDNKVEVKEIKKPDFTKRGAKDKLYAFSEIIEDMAKNNSKVLDNAVTQSISETLGKGK